MVGSNRLSLHDHTYLILSTRYHRPTRPSLFNLVIYQADPLPNLENNPRHSQTLRLPIQVGLSQHRGTGRTRGYANSLISHRRATLSHNPYNNLVLPSLSPFQRGQPMPKSPNVGYLTHSYLLPSMDFRYQHCGLDHRNRKRTLVQRRLSKPRLYGTLRHWQFRGLLRLLPFLGSLLRYYRTRAQTHRNYPTPPLCRLLGPHWVARTNMLVRPGHSLDSRPRQGRGWLGSPQHTTQNQKSFLRNLESRYHLCQALPLNQ